MIRPSILNYLGIAARSAQPTPSALGHELMTDRKNPISPVTIFALVIIVGILIGLCPCSFSCSSERARRVGCMNNLKALGNVLMLRVQDNGGTAASLLSITSVANDPRLFICPSSGHKPGGLANVDQWPDYTLVAGMGTGSPSHSVVVCCPPEHHGGKGGNILFDDGSVQWFDAVQFRNQMRPRQTPGGNSQPAQRGSRTPQE